MGRDLTMALFLVSIDRTNRLRDLSDDEILSSVKSAVVDWLDLKEEDVAVSTVNEEAS